MVAAVQNKDHTIFCAARSSVVDFDGPLPPPALGERRHRGHTRRLVSVRRAAYVGLPLWSLVHIQMDAQSFREALHPREGSFVPLG